MKTHKINISVTIDHTLAQRLAETSASSGLPKSLIVESALKDYLNGASLSHIMKAFRELTNNQSLLEESLRVIANFIVDCLREKQNILVDKITKRPICSK